MKTLFFTLTLSMSANIFAQSSVFKPEPNPMLKKSVMFQTDGFMEKTSLETVSSVDRFILETTQGSGMGIVEAAIESVSRRAKAGCQNGPADFGKSIGQFTDDFSKTISELSCNAAELYKRTKKLDESICKSMAGCLHKKFNLFTPNRAAILRKAQEQVATEAIALLANKPVINMIEDEELMAFARAKFGDDEVPAVCKGVNASFITDKTEGKALCKTNIVDEGFKMAMENCKVPGAGCFKDYADFSKNKKTVNGETSILGEFIQLKSSQTAKKMTDRESVINDELAKIMIDTSMTPDQRADKILYYMDMHSSELDPVYRSYLVDSKRNLNQGLKDTVKESFANYIASNKDFNLDSIRKTMNELKRNELKRLLNASCTGGSKIKELCEVADRVLVGSGVVVKERHFEAMLSKEDWSKTRKFNSEELITHVARCNTFQINTSNVEPRESIIKLSGGKNLFIKNSDGVFMATTLSLGDGISGETFQSSIAQVVRVNADGKIKITEFGKTKEDTSEKSRADRTSESVLTSRLSKNLPLEYDVKRPESLTVKNLGPAKIEKPETNAEMIVTKEAGSAGTHAAINSTAQGLMGQDPMMMGKPVTPGGNPSQRTIDSTIVGDFSTPAESAAKPRTSGDTEYQKLISKISGLEDKLAAASKKPVTDFDVKAAPKVEEESELSKELRNAKAALADLNKAAVRDSAVTAKTVKRSTRSDRNNVTQSEDEDDVEESAPGVVSGSYAASAVAPAPSSSGRSAGSSGGSAETSGRAPSSIDDAKSAIRSSSGGSSGDGNSVEVSSAVLTRLDGISGAKANETISKMIYAESGNPFYIEEGGMVKQIIPEVVDGKILKDEDGNPVYKTVVKGKVGEFKVDKVTGKKKELVAKSASPADVKIQDYQKVSAPAVRYRELQDILKLKK